TDQDLGWRARPWRLRHYVMMEITVLGRYWDQAGKVSSGTRNRGKASGAQGAARLDRISTISEHCRGRPLPTQSGPSASPAAIPAPVQGFGCRPVASYPPVLRAGVRKPPGKEPAGGRVGGCRYGGLPVRRLG